MYLGSAQNNVANTSHFFPEFFGGIIDMKNKKKKENVTSAWAEKGFDEHSRACDKKKKGSCFVLWFCFIFSYQESWN